MGELLVNRWALLWQNLVRDHDIGVNVKYCPQCAGELQQKNIDGVARLACTNASCRFVFWNNPVPVVAALVRLDEKYIIARNAQWPAGLYSVITGYLESGESPEQAVLREVHEELGLSGIAVTHIGNYSFYKKNQIILAYEVVATGEISANDELAAIKQLSPGELLEYDFGPLLVTRRIVQDWQKLNSHR